MNTKLVKVGLVAVAMTSTAALAAPPDWKYIEGSYVESEFDENAFNDVEPDGFGIAGAWNFDDIFVQGSYSAQEDDIGVPGFGSADLELDIFNLGVGYKYSLQENTDVYGRVSYEYWKLELGPVDEDDNGYSVAAGIRSVVWQGLELNAEVGYLDVGDAVDGEGFFKLGAIYSFDNGIGLGMSYAEIDELSTIAATLRYSFRGL